MVSPLYVNVPGTTFSSFAQGGYPIDGDQLVGLRNNVNTIFNAAASVDASAITIAVHQLHHGFSFGNILAINNGTPSSGYVLASAAPNSNDAVAGIVDSVIDADNFILLIQGLVTGFSPLLIANSIYYLDWVIPGGYTNIAPPTRQIPPYIEKILMLSTASAAGVTSSAVWLNYRGSTV